MQEVLVCLRNYWRFGKPDLAEREPECSGGDMEEQAVSSSLHPLAPELWERSSLPREFSLECSMVVHSLVVLTLSCTVES